MICFHVGRPGIQLFDWRRYFFILLLFLFVFPKGGIKLAGIPLTWGYLILGCIAIFSLFRGKFTVHKERIQALLALIPFQVIAAFTMFYNGIANRGMAISFWISFLILPYSFLLLFSKEIEEFDLEWFLNLFKKAMLFVAIYGIILFFCKIFTGRFIEIPLITVNLGDVGELETKNITRGAYFKLISTYNNGNLYGACMLMALPLYCFLEKRKARIYLVKFALLLTLSRTVWIGVFAHEILYRFFLAPNLARAIRSSVLAMFIVTSLLMLLLWSIGFSPLFLFDQNLGGRRSHVEALTQIGLLSHNPFQGILEVVYAGIVHSFGWIGLLTFLIGMGFSLFFRAASSAQLSLMHRVILIGLVNYLIICGSDGAMLYLPTMVFYWFFVSLFLRKKLQLCFMRQNLQPQQRGQ